LCPLHIANAKRIGIGGGDTKISRRGRSGMTRPEFLKGFAIFAITTAAALLSTPYVDRYVEGVAPAKTEIPDSQPNTPATAKAPPATCVQADGSYKNWPWPNAPMLSPRCAPEK
jgi:hypothetical protein